MPKPNSEREHYKQYNRRKPRARLNINFVVVVHGIPLIDNGAIGQRLDEIDEPTAQRKTVNPS
jgi:hypothetical protein